MTHQALIGQDTINPHVSRNGINPFREGAGKSGAVWPLRPFQIVSLLEVLEFFADSFDAMVSRLRIYISDLKTEIERRTGQDTLNATDVAHAREVLKLIENFARPFRMSDTMKRVYPAFMKATYSTSLEKMLWVMEELENDIRRDLRVITLMYFPSDKVEYLEEWRKNRHGYEGLFDDEEVAVSKRVSTRFPEANKEISAAGTCYAIEEYTACVFHLMRACEIGARAMVRGLKVQSFLMNQKHRRIPVELCDWHTLITGIQKGVDAKAAGVGTNTRKKEVFEFYNHALGSFRNFKDAWRNHVSHTRELYKPGRTKDIMDNTRQFMQHLATKLKE